MPRESESLIAMKPSVIQTFPTTKHADYRMGGFRSVRRWLRRCAKVTHELMAPAVCDEDTRILRGLTTVDQ